MSRLGTKNTLVELGIRRSLYRLGLRYRLHTPVPGLRRRSIDIAFVGVKVAVFVDGCFWHGCPTHGTIPRSNTGWWANKIKSNVDRDAETAAHLTELGWLVLRFWEHEDPDDVARAVRARVVALRSNGSPRREGNVRGMPNPEEAVAHSAASHYDAL
jgi:DNA mismatch endonuclease (patch repair protein)